MSLQPVLRDRRMLQGASMLDLSYAPNVSWLFPDLVFADRIRAVAEAGFAAFELGFPSRVDIPAVEALREEYGLQVALFNLDVSVWDGKCRGYLADPRHRDEFERKFEQALELAGRLKCRCVMVPVGNRVPELPREAQREHIVETLRRAAPLAEEQDLILTIEALNQFDNPGYYLDSSREGIEIIQAVDHACVRFQYDFYHMQLLEGNLINTFTRNVEYIGHFQVADAPGRHEPGTGEINFSRVLADVAASSYRGYVGLEYRPSAEEGAALAWLPVEARANLPD